jgi:hypothetical protein
MLSVIGRQMLFDASLGPSWIKIKVSLSNRLQIEVVRQSELNRNQHRISQHLKYK